MTLRVGMIGAGWVTQHHLAGWQRLGGRARVVAIADPVEARAQARASAFGIERVYCDAGQLLEEGGIDAVDIAAPRESHADLVRMAAARGLHILCQKPLAPTYDTAVALVDEVEGHSRLMVHENWRFRPYYRQIKKWLLEGRIGRVVQAQMTLLSSGLVPDASGALPAVPRQPFLVTLDRALVMEVAIHHIDTLRFLFGEMTVVHARIGKSCPEMAGEDRAFISFDTAAGGVACLLGNLRTHGEPPALGDRLVLIGEHGTIRLLGNGLVCEGERPAVQHFDLAASYFDSYAATIEHFVGALASGSDFETNPRDNLRTLQLVEEIYARSPS